MKRILVILGILMVQGVEGQVNVFDCGVYIDAVTQQEIEAASYNNTYFGTCILFDSNHDYTGSVNRNVYASNQINVKENFHAGGANNAGVMHLKIEEESPLNVAVMNYEDLYEVLRYKKLELGIELPNDILTRVNNYLQQEGVHSDELNPFVEWDLDVEAVFSHADWYEVVDGFYTREYAVNTSTNDWDDVGTGFPMRLRYAPPKNGNWICHVRIKAEGVIVYQSPNFSFNVVESGDPGYVHVHSNKRNLMRGDKMIYPVGQNFPSPEEGGLPWGIDNPLFTPSNTTKAARPSNWSNYLSKIESYFNQGGKYIRTLQTPWSSLIEFEKKGNYYDRLHYAWEQDRLMDLCEDHDALLQFNMMIQEPFMEYGDYNIRLWDWNYWILNDSLCTFSYDTTDFNVYCYNDNPLPSGGKMAHEMFTNEDDLKYHEQRTRYYIARYGYSTKIYEFELLSEPYHLDQKWTPGHCEFSPTNVFEKEPYLLDGTAQQTVVFEAIETYHERMASYIKDHMQHWQQLIGVNAVYPAWKPEGTIYHDQSIHSELIDIVGINWYNKAPFKYIISGHDDPDNNNFTFSDENTFARAVTYFQYNWDEISRPVILSEGDHGDNTHGCSGDVGSKIDAMCMGFTGLCGFNFWYGKDGPNIIGEPDQSDVWPPAIRALEHMNSDDVINTLNNGYGGWKQGRQFEKHSSSDDAASKELQYYISEDKESAVGYVRNRTYNLSTKATNSSCYQNLETPLNTLTDINWDDGFTDKLLWVTGLKNNVDYQIDWYSFSDGWYLESECQNTNGDKFKLEHPQLITTFYDRPIVWFVIKQQNCQSGMMTNNITTQQKTTNLQELADSELTQATLNTTNIRVFPNPLNNELLIETSVIDEVEIHSVDGVRVAISKVDAGVNRLSTNSFAQGVYFLYFKNQNISVKIVKQ